MLGESLNWRDPSISFVIGLTIRNTVDALAIGRRKPDTSHVAVRCLSVHARYLCAHAGECCRAGWAIPVEEPLVQPLRTLGFRIGADRVAPVAPNGDCAFFEADAGRLCAIHRRGGPSLLPSVCRHFPRVVVNDPRGTSVTLSHYCPTAAGLLFERVPLAIVEAPRSLALDGALEGLDATSVLPPLLDRDVLTDWDGYTAWEEEAVRLLNAEEGEPEQVVEWLIGATGAVCAWRPRDGSLTSAVRQAFAGTSVRPSGSLAWNGFGRTVNAWLAAHTFASWAAYEPDGLRAIPETVREALALLRQERDSRGVLTRDTLLASIRAADLRLRHGAGVRP
jgi:Fe-S-cluster containining protein